MMGQRQTQTLGAAGGRVDLNLGLRQQLGDDHQVHVVVVHHEDVGVRRLKALLVGFAVVCPGPGGQREGSKLLIAQNVLVQPDDKG